MKKIAEKIWKEWARYGLRWRMHCSVLLAALCVVCMYSRGETAPMDTDYSAPMVSSVSPENLSVNAAHGKITAIFTEKIWRKTLKKENFIVRQGATPIQGRVYCFDNTAVFTPKRPLLANTLYTATISAGVMDLEGNSMQNDFVWSFTTGAFPDTTPPEVDFVNPVNLAENAPINRSITATFNEMIDPAKIKKNSFNLAKQEPGKNRMRSKRVKGTVAFTGTTVIFTPSSNLDPDSLYKATIKTRATDLSGNTMMESTYEWTFTTGSNVDVTAPMVSLVTPANDAADVPLNKKIAATFSEAIHPLTITTATFRLLNGNTPVQGTVIYDGITATFTPFDTLEDNTEYTSIITTATTDLAGNPLEANYVWYWNTGNSAETTAPTVTFTIPSANETDVPLNRKIAATFSEDMDQLTISPDTFTLLDGSTPVSGTVVYSLISNVATFTPDSDLDPDTEYTSTITTGATDLAGNPLEVDNVWSWTTGASRDTLAPTVTSTNPVDNETNVPINKKIAATFSEAMDPLTITAHTFTLLDGITPVTGTVAYDLTSNVATFTPDSDLAPDTEYTAIITTGAIDLAGNHLGADYVWSFTTGTWTFINPEPVIGFEPDDILQPYGVLAGTAITLGGPGLHVDGDVGISPGNTCNGCDSTTVSGVIENGTANAAAAKVALGAAYDDAVSRTTNVCTLIASGILTANPSAACGGNANGVFKAGLYWSASSIELPVDGTITLDGENDPNAVFIFQAGSTITALANSNVVLANEAQASNVFWVAGSSATIGGTTADFAGTVIALEDFTVNTGTDMLGRALARNGSVTVQTGALITVPSP